MTKFTAIDPNGVMLTRNSKTHTYTFCVVSRPDPEYFRELAMAKSMLNVHRKNFAYFTALVDGTSQWLVKPDWRTEEQQAEMSADSISRAKQALNGCLTVDEYVDYKIRQDLNSINSVNYTYYHLEGWCSRRDLAEKLASKARGQRRLDVTILSVV